MKLRKDKLDYEFLPSAIEIVESPPSPLGSFFIWVVLAIIIVSLIWSYCSKVDVVVSTRGEVSIESEAKQVKPLTTGKIKEIYVKEGDYVEEGTIMASLDSSQINLELAKAKNNLVNEKIELNIIYSEIDGRDIFYDINIDELENKDKNYYLKYSNSKKAIDKLNEKANEDSLNEINSKLEEEEKKLDDLELKLQEESNKSDNTIAITYAQRDVDEQKEVVDDTKKKLESQKEQDEKTKKNNENQIYNLAKEKEKSIEDIKLSIKSYEEQLGNLNIIAPVNGQVDVLNSAIVGTIVSPEVTVAKVIPQVAEGELIIKIPNKDISKINTGMETMIKVDAYPYNTYGVVKGEIEEISLDSIVDNQGNSFYKAKIKLLEGSEKLKFGMQFTADINVENKRVIELLLDPIKKGFEDMNKNV